MRLELLIKTALKTDIPLIAVETDDPLNAYKIISYHLGAPVCHEWPTKKSTITPTPQELGDIIVPHLTKSGSRVGVLSSPIKDYEKLYKSLLGTKYQVVLVNPPEEAIPYTFNCGLLSIPEEIIRGFVAKHATAENVEAIVSSLKGLNLKQVLDVAKLASCNGSFTPQSVQKVRRSLYTDIKGLQLISEDFSDVFYVEHPALERWLDLDGFLFKNSEILQPRGLMFSGPPGTGKTMGAKWLSFKLDVPLYRLDFSSMLSRWQGETEQALLTALKVAESVSPCFLLLDEVDKLFVESHDSGSTSRCLSILLWWLQEHKSKVVTIMTSNKIETMPKELYRKGRIDSVIEFSLLSIPNAIEFVKHLHQWWCKKLKVTLEVDKYSLDTEVELSEASLVEHYMKWLKTEYIKTLKGVNHE